MCSVPKGVCDHELSSHAGFLLLPFSCGPILSCATWVAFSNTVFSLSLVSSISANSTLQRLPREKSNFNRKKGLFLRRSRIILLHRLVDWWSILLIDWLLVWLTNVLFFCWLIDDLLCWLIDDLFCWLIDYLFCWLIDGLFYWLIDDLFCWQIDDLFCWLIWRSVLLADWLMICCVGWLMICFKISLMIYFAGWMQPLSWLGQAAVMITDREIRLE